MEQALAALAITHAAAGPAITEHAIHLVSLHDLDRDVGHEAEVVTAQRARNPKRRIGPVSPRLAIGLHRNPFRMRVHSRLMQRMRIGAGDDVHPLFAAALHHFAERIVIGQKLTAVM